MPQSEKIYNLKSVPAALHSVRFWQFFAMMTLGNIFGGIFSYQYKPLGNAAKISDKLLITAASVSSVTQFCTRLSVGYSYDKVGFRPIFCLLMVANMTTAFSAYQAVHTPWLYFIII